MNKIKQKLKQKKGETLVEALISMMIALLSMAFLCSSVMVATNINIANRNNDEKFSEQLKKAETMQTPNVEAGNDASKVLEVSFQKNGVEVEHVTVQNVGAIEESEHSLIFYAGEENDIFISYDYIP